MRLHFTRKQCEVILEGLMALRGEHFIATGEGRGHKDEEIWETIKAKIAKEMAPRIDR